MNHAVLPGSVQVTGHGQEFEHQFFSKILADALWVDERDWMYEHVPGKTARDELHQVKVFLTEKK